jgi:hypothetical protein
MGKRLWSPLLVGALCATLLTSVDVTAQGSPGDRGYRGGPPWWQSGRQDGRRAPRVPRGVRDPAFARGYSDGWEKGLDDGRDRDRYNPVRHGDYRSGDEGYTRAYGPKEAYRNNYRTGFRQGYEDGYRDGTRHRR